jgi:hypothetical protein
LAAISRGEAVKIVGDSHNIQTATANPELPILGALRGDSMHPILQIEQTPLPPYGRGAEHQLPQALLRLNMSQFATASVFIGEAATAQPVT